MARVVIKSDVTVSGQSFHRGEVIEASAALVATLGSNARSCTAVAGRVSPSHDDTGEIVGVSNGAP